MNTERATPDPATIRAALDVACRAPSVHNTQPWHWSIAANSVHLFADRARQLAVIDRTGRELTISCGAALHHASVAFRALGWRPDVRILPNLANHDHLAAIEFVPLPRIDQRSLTQVAATGHRHTDRRPYPPDRIPALVLDRLVGAVTGSGVRLTPLLADDVRRDVLIALREADTVQRANPMYRGELGEWSRRRLGAVQGVPARSVPKTPAAGRALPGRDFGPGELEVPPAMDDGATLLLLSTGADAQADWLRAGQALSAVLLAATSEGLATCTLSQVAELRVPRDLVRRVALAGIGEPQLVLRVGWAPTAEFPGPATPRLPLDEVAGQWTDY